MQEQIKKINDTLAKQEAQLSTLTDTSNLMATQVVSMQNDISYSSIAVFTPSSQGFQKIDTGVGILLVSLKNIEKYANGYKITFQIGNTSTATFYNSKIRIVYGPDYDDKNLNGKKIDRKPYETVIAKELLPAHWNDVSVVLSPADKNDLEKIIMTIQPDGIKMPLDPRNNLS